MALFIVMLVAGIDAIHLSVNNEITLTKKMTAFTKSAGTDNESRLERPGLFVQVSIYSHNTSHLCTISSSN